MHRVLIAGEINDAALTLPSQVSVWSNFRVDPDESKLSFNTYQTHLFSNKTDLILVENVTVFFEVNM